MQQLVDVFQWDIDFFALRKGDAFSLVVKKKYSGDDAVGYGPIVAATFTHDGQTFDLKLTDVEKVLAAVRTGPPISRRSRVTSPMIRMARPGPGKGWRQTMPSGSYLALNHPTFEVTGEKMATAIRYWNEYGTPPGTHRTPAELARFLDGMDLVEPGVVSITRWRPEAMSSGEPEEIDQFGGVGRKRRPHRGGHRFTKLLEVGVSLRAFFRDLR